METKTIKVNFAQLSVFLQMLIDIAETDDVYELIEFCCENSDNTITLEEPDVSKYVN